MSLVVFKNLLVWRRVSPSPDPAAGGLRRPSVQTGLQYHASHTSSSTAVEEEDVESHSTKRRIHPTTPASGRFRVNGRVVADAMIGLIDGVTVPFALTAGLSALESTRIVIFGGLAELVLGIISMTLGGRLGAKSETASYLATRSETEDLVANSSSQSMDHVRGVFKPYNIPAKLIDELTEHVSSSPKTMVEFLMRFHHRTEDPGLSGAMGSALTIGIGYFVGGLIPLIPYFCVHESELYTALYISIAVVVVALFTLGFMNTWLVTGKVGARSGSLDGMQTVLVGVAAGAAAWGLVKAFDSYVKHGD